MRCWFLMLTLVTTAFAASDAPQPETAGDFVRVTQSPGTKKNSPLFQHGSFWTSNGTGDAGHGKLTLRFAAAPETLELYVAGFPTSPEIRLVLQDPEGGSELKLSLRSPPGPDWCLYRWPLPKPWPGQPALLIAEDNSSDTWIGLGVAPTTAGRRTAFSVLATSTAAVLLTVAPFFAALAWLRRRMSADPALHVTLALVTSGLLALAVFFAFYLAHGLGLAVVLVAGVVTTTIAVRAWRTGSRWNACLPLATATLLGIFIISVTFLYGGAESPDGIPAGRHDFNLPPDNLIPDMLAEKIYRQEPLRPFLADWLTSDRPPLQSGSLLMIRPLIASAAGKLAGAITAQLSVYAGLWVFLCACGADLRTRRWCAVAFVSSGFFLVHTLYTWPKLLPAGFLLAAAGLLYRAGREQRRATKLELGAIGSCFALAMLGHGGSLFGILALVLVHVVHDFRHAWRQLPVIAAIALVVFSPWLAYQHWADPPGDRLIKYHLANHQPIDPRGSLPVIAEAYRKAGWSTAVHHKLTNFRVLVGDFTHLFPSLGTAAGEAVKGEWRAAWWRTANAIQGGAFFHLLQSLGLLAVGLGGLWRGRQKGERWLDRPDGFCFAAASASIVVWCLLMFGPEAAVVHQGSFLTGALLHLACVLGLLRFHRSILSGVFALHLVIFAGIWVLSPTWDPWHRLLRSGADPFWAIVLLCSGALLAFCSSRSIAGATSS